MKQPELRKKYAYYYNNDFQNKVVAEANKIDELVSSIDKNNDDLKNQIQQTISDIKRLESEKDPNSALIPGIKIERLMRQMADQPSYEPMQIKYWLDECWKTVEEINEEIREQERGYVLYYRHLQRKCEHKVNFIQSHADFKIEALEQALL